MLDQFGAGDGGDEKYRRGRRRALRLVNRAMEGALEEGLVDFAQLALGFGIFHTDHDAFGMEEITHRRTLAQEFRVRGHAELGAIAAAIDLQSVPKFLARVRRHGAFLDHQFRRARCRRDLPGHVIDGGKIGFAGIERGRSYANENNIRRVNRLGAIGREAQPTGRGDALHDAIKAGLVDR